MGGEVAVGRRTSVGVPHLESLLLGAFETHEGRHADQPLVGFLSDGCTTRTKQTQGGLAMRVLRKASSATSRSGERLFSLWS